MISGVVRKTDSAAFLFGQEFYFLKKADLGNKILYTKVKWNFLEKLDYLFDYFNNSYISKAVGG